MISLFLYAALNQTTQQGGLNLTSRFQEVAPLPLPPIKIDSRLKEGLGFAQQMAQSRYLQGRVIWIDATANIERINTQEKIVDLVKKIKDAGFNTIVLDVKPISGYTLFPSHYAPKLTEWRGKTIPVDFDPVKVFSEEAHTKELSLMCSLNAFSEGHNLMKVGIGYTHPDWQSVFYVADPTIKAPNGVTYPLSFNGGNGETVHAYRDSKQLPPPSPGNFVVSLTHQRAVHEGYEDGGYEHVPIPVPYGGYVLYGSGDAAKFLRDNLHPGDVIQLGTDPKFVPSGGRQEDQYPLMMNPNSMEVQDYELSILRELVTNYPIDGILYDDRYRYAGIYADFSPTSRRLFEAAIGKPVNWPNDIYKFTLGNFQNRGLEPGPYFDAWMAWRAQQLRKFMVKVRATVHVARPGVQVGLYAGSWYGEYPALGNNWGSEGFDQGFWFLTQDYKRAALAPMLDFLMTGCYYPQATIYDALSSGVGIGSTVESAGIMCNRIVRDQTWVYAGIALSQFKGNPEGLADALQAACSSTQGVMVFDLSHDIEPMWPVFTQAFKYPAKAPHQIVNLLEAVRAQRLSADRRKTPEPPFIMTSGSSGTGQ